MVKIIIVGFGNVGRSLIKILHKQKEDLLNNHNFNPQIVAISELNGALINSGGLSLQELVNLGDISTGKGFIPNKSCLDIIKEVDADILVECAWTDNKTGEPALSHIKEAMKKKINVASSNKGPFYLKFKELKRLAKENNVIYGIESTVGSQIPCLAAKDGLAGAKITSIRAILNGTSNYILSRMSSEGLPFDLALKEAQELGYAEANPKLDIEGYDAAGKMVILANELLGWDKTMADVDIAGIKEVSPQAIELAKNDNYLIKHVGIAKNNEISVGLQLVKKDSPLAVNGTLNVVELHTENAGPITLVGRGAGGSEAAAGILSDMIRISKLKQF